MRAALERSDVEVVAYNDPFIDPEVSLSLMSVYLVTISVLLSQVDSHDSLLTRFFLNPCFAVCRIHASL
jgi:hypothetical protein